MLTPASSRLSCYNEVGVYRSQLTDVKEQGRQRQDKIARFRRRKQLEESIQELRLQATKDRADDEITVRPQLIYTTIIINTLRYTDYTVLSSFLRQSCLVFTNMTSALEVFLNVMRYINPRFTYFYLLSGIQQIA